MMKSGHSITRPVALWSGVALVVLGGIVAALAIWSGIRAGKSLREAKTMAEELRANGAIVENYYEVLGNPPGVPTPVVRAAPYPSYLVAGILVAVGGVLIWRAGSFPQERELAGGTGDGDAGMPGRRG